jgi:hypothetical protein
VNHATDIRRGPPWKLTERLAPDNQYVAPDIAFTPQLAPNAGDPP